MTLYYPTTSNFIQKTLDAQLLTGITASATLNNVTSIQNKAGVMIIDRVDANGVETPSKVEVISFAGTSGSTVTTLVRGLGGTTDQDHEVGAIVEFGPDIVWAQGLIDTFNVEHNEDGTHDTNYVVTPTGTQTLTNKTLTSPKVGTAILDTNGNEVIKTPATTSAVNEITITNSATGNAVQVSATGDDTNIDLKLVAKGTGGIKDKNGEALSPNQSTNSQLLINADFEVAQRGTTFSLSASAAYTLDRWYVSSGGGSGATTVTQEEFALGQTDVPGNPKYFLKYNQTGSASTSGEITQKVEGVHWYSGGKCVSTIWLKATSGTITVTPQIVQYFGSGGSPSATVVTAGSDYTVTTTWTKFTTTFTVPSVSGKTLGTDGKHSFWFRLLPPTGSTYILNVARAKVNAGDVALPFQPKSEWQEKQDCLRYFERIAPAAAYQNLATGFNSSTTNAIQNLYYVEKRTIPTITFSSVTEFGVNNGADTATRSTGISYGSGAGRTSTKMTRIDVTVASGLTAGQGSTLIGWDTAANTYIDVSAEL